MKKPLLFLVLCLLPLCCFAMEWGEVGRNKLSLPLFGSDGKLANPPIWNASSFEGVLADTKLTKYASYENESFWDLTKWVWIPILAIGGIGSFIAAGLLLVGGVLNEGEMALMMGVGALAGGAGIVLWVFEFYD